MRIARWRPIAVRAAVCLAALLVTAACDRLAEKPRFQSTDVTGVGWGEDFQLLDVNGKPRRIADYRGKVVMLFMGYTNCPDVCPTTLARMAKAVRELGGDGTRVQGLFVTLDPARDTAAVLARYVRAFDPAFVALRGDAAATERTAKEFKAFYLPHHADVHGSYSVEHLDTIFVFDKLGRLRLLIGPEVAMSAIVHDLRALVQQ